VRAFPAGGFGEGSARFYAASRRIAERPDLDHHVWSGYVRDIASNDLSGNLNVHAGQEFQDRHVSYE
jgi:hypothetical protein